jgi:hypothetical protein
LSINAVRSACFREFSDFCLSHFTIFLKSCHSSTQDLFFTLWRAFSLKVAAIEMILQSIHARLSFLWMFSGLWWPFLFFSLENFSLWWQLSIQRFCARSPVFLNIFERYLHDKNAFSKTVL